MATSPPTRQSSRRSAVELRGEDDGVRQIGEIAEEDEAAGVEGGLCIASRNRRRKKPRQRLAPARKKPFAPSIHRVPSSESPPPETTQWTWG